MLFVNVKYLQGRADVVLVADQHAGRDGRPFGSFCEIDGRWTEIASAHKMKTTNEV